MSEYCKSSLSGSNDVVLKVIECRVPRIFEYEGRHVARWVNV